MTHEIDGCHKKKKKKGGEGGGEREKWEETELSIIKEIEQMNNMP